GVAVTGGTFDFDGGSLAAGVVLNNATLNLGTGGTGPADFIALGNSTLDGNVAAGQSILLPGSDAGGSATPTWASGPTNPRTPAHTPPRPPRPRTIPRGGTRASPPRAAPCPPPPAAPSTSRPAAAAAAASAATSPTTARSTSAAASAWSSRAAPPRPPSRWRAG